MLQEKHCTTRQLFATSSSVKGTLLSFNQLIYGIKSLVNVNINMDKHIQNLSIMCRVCTNRVQTAREINSKKRKILAKEHMDHIHIFYGIDISKDNEHVHGQYLCSRCHKRLIHSFKTWYRGPEEHELNLEGVYGVSNTNVESKNI